MGTHQELLANGGFYARLYEMQFEKHAHAHHSISAGSL